MGKGTDNIIAFIRVSRPNHNADVYKNHKLYMNPQTSFIKGELTEGQLDNLETIVYDGPLQLFWSDEERKHWHKISGEITSVRYNPDAYIFCFYMVLASKLEYNSGAGEYVYTVPWQYIKKFWKKDRENELLIILNTPAFIEVFKESVLDTGYTAVSGKVYYDLEKKGITTEYIDSVIRDPLTVVFHKETSHIDEQEYRFAVLVPGRPPSFELPLKRNDTLTYRILPLRENCSVSLLFEGVQMTEDGSKLRMANKVSARFIPEDANVEEK